MKPDKPKELPQMFLVEVENDTLRQGWAVRTGRERRNSTAQANFKPDMRDRRLYHPRSLFTLKNQTGPNARGMERAACQKMPSISRI
jgi:hypothetical protein